MIIGMTEIDSEIETEFEIEYQEYFEVDINN